MIGDGDGNMDELELPPLPTHEEVLICSEETTSEEVLTGLALYGSKTSFCHSLNSII